MNTFARGPETPRLKAGSKLDGCEVKPVRKGCGFGCLGFVVLFGAIFALVMYLTRPIVTCAEVFLSQLGNRQTKEAYASASRSFQAGISLTQLEQFSHLYGLDQVRQGSVSWGNRKIRNKDGWVSGSFPSKSGNTIHLQVELHYEDGAWKVSSLRTE